MELEDIFGNGGRNGLFPHSDNVPIPYPDHPEDKISKSWLIKPIKDNERIKGDFFGWYYPGEGIKKMMKPNDELWAFAYFFPLSSRAGVAIIRDGVIVHASLRMIS